MQIGQLNHVYSFSSVATDNAGDTEAQHASPDTTMLIGQLPAPVIAGISPDTGTNANDGVTNAASVTLSGSAEPNDTITLYDNGSLAGSTTANAAGLWSATGVALTEGSNALTAVAHDQAGDVSSAGSFLATRDSTPPIAPTISGISPDTGPSDSDGITDTGQLSIDGTAEAGSTVAVYDGATRIGIATADGLGAWSLTPAPLAQGSHGLTATATDLAGNASAASPDFMVKVQYPPVLLQSVLALTVGEGQSLGNLWSQVITNGQDLDQASLAVSAVAATGPSARSPTTRRSRCSATWPRAPTRRSRWTASATP